MAWGPAYCPPTCDCCPATVAAAIPRRSPHPDDLDPRDPLPDVTANTNRTFQGYY